MARIKICKYITPARTYLCYDMTLIYNYINFFNNIKLLVYIYVMTAINGNRYIKVAYLKLT